MLSIFKIVGKNKMILVNAIVIDESLTFAYQQIKNMFFKGEKGIEFNATIFGTAVENMTPSIAMYSVCNLISNTVCSVVEIEKKTEEDLLDTFIHQTNLKARTKNVLHAADVFTLRDLIKHTENRMLHFYGVGPVIMDELKKYMDVVGISFKQE